MRWAEVQAIHKTQRGIYTVRGEVVSLLCSQTKDARYADEVSDDVILYRVTASTSQPAVQLLENTVGSAKAVHVFEKLGVNHWFDHGMWTVVELQRESVVTSTFVLRRVEPVSDAPST
jgi:hypothetical protein